jgi:hypothetical protein
MSHTSSQPRRKIDVVLWIVQGVLALLFLFAGAMKLIMPIAALTQQSPMPGAFIRFIGVLEVLGALGLFVPALLRLRHELTPLAAAGLVIIMSGAVGSTLATGQIAGAAMPVAVGLLLAFVAYGRWQGVPARRAAVRPTVLRRSAA